LSHFYIKKNKGAKQKWTKRDKKREIKCKKKQKAKKGVDKKA